MENLLWLHVDMRHKLQECISALETAEKALKELLDMQEDVEVSQKWISFQIVAISIDKHRFEHKIEQLVARDMYS